VDVSRSGSIRSGAPDRDLRFYPFVGIRVGQLVYSAIAIVGNDEK
jgi:hypothetical protein